MIIVGISAYYHDSSIAILIDGKIKFAAHEERYLRIKNYKFFPLEALKNGIKFCGIELKDVDYFVFYEKPYIKFERIIKNFINFSPKGFSQFIFFFKEWASKKFFLKREIIKNLKLIDKNFRNLKLKYSNHHLSHAGSAFFPSPFNEAIILVNDAVGEFSTTSISIGYENKIVEKYHINYPDSIGLLYSAFTYFLGFKVNADEYKVMGLAPYGEPIYYELIKNHLIDIKSDGSYSLNQSYFKYTTSMFMVGEKFEKLFKNKVRKKNDDIKKIHKDLAASIQKIVEEVLLNVANFASKKFNIKNICFSGGVSLNCVANTYILNNSNFKNCWIQPASGDAGGSLGAALSFYYMHFDNIRKTQKEDMMQLSYLGQNYSNDEIQNTLEKRNINYSKLEDQNIIQTISKYIVRNKIIGIFRGRTEFGPRALGNRSIICNACNKDMKKILNQKIKFREGFRPFAGMILEDNIKDYFDTPFQKSEFMILVGYLKEKLRNNIPFPSVIHEDFSSRLQTIDQKNYFYYQLLNKLNKNDNIPMIINTSFNVKDEPIVENPNDAINTFYRSDIDVLFIENFMIKKNEDCNS